MSQDNETRNFNDRYRKDIDLFFKGEDHEIMTHSKENGHVWVAGGRYFQTLTVEPPEGGQYEIAVRFKKECSEYGDDTRYPFSGYKAVEGWMIGINTDGH